MDEFLSVERAREQVLRATPEVGNERVFLSEAAGRRAAESFDAPADSPPFDNSSRDGYAFRWSDLDDGSAELELVGRSAAGDAYEGSVGAGSAVRILTGAPVPDGTDTVAMQEHCEELDGGGRVRVTAPDPGRGAWVRAAGAYISEGQPLIRAGDRIGSAEVGLLASFGRSLVAVRRRPRVAIVTAGDELVPIDRRPDDDEIVDSNAHLLASLVRRHGGEPLVSPIAEDRLEAVEDTFERALEAADVVVSCGGVSVGDRDVVGDVITDLTGGLDFWKVRSKPGKPLAFGGVDRQRPVPLLGLPGNPNSCFVSFHQFVRPALAVAQGVSPANAGPDPIRARLGDDVHSTPARRQYLAGRLERTGDGPVFHPFEQQKSANLALFCGADAFGRVEEDVGRMEAGERIFVEEF
ncbi:MAG: gephyrin-like molybdotransferase Glp [Bradymonadaceae bacterium]